MSVCLQITQASFRWPKQQTDCLSIQQLQLKMGQSLFIHGPSGCGKSTLLNLIAGVISPTEGEVSVLPEIQGRIKKPNSDQLRADYIGYIFQQFNLLPFLNVVDNVLLSCQFSKRRAQNTLQQFETLEQAAQYWLDAFNIDKTLYHQPVNQLSIGQQQRVAAARSLIGHPALIIADEPTSALDDENAQHFIDTLIKHCKDIQSSLIFVSHDLRLANHFDQQFSLATQHKQAQVTSTPQVEPLLPEITEEASS